MPCTTVGECQKTQKKLKELFIDKGGVVGGAK